MTLEEFALKYPEVVSQVQNVVFPTSYKVVRVKDARHLVETIIELGENIAVDMQAVKDSLNLYDIDNDLFEDYKNFKKDLNILLENTSKHKRDKDLD
jgi:hypothetical protein